MVSTLFISSWIYAELAFHRLFAPFHRVNVTLQDAERQILPNKATVSFTDPTVYSTLCRVCYDFPQDCGVLCNSLYSRFLHCFKKQSDHFSGKKDIVSRSH